MEKEPLGAARAAAGLSWSWFKRSERSAKPDNEVIQKNPSLSLGGLGDALHVKINEFGCCPAEETTTIKSCRTNSPFGRTRSPAMPTAAGRGCGARCCPSQAECRIRALLHYRGPLRPGRGLLAAALMYLSPCSRQIEGGKARNELCLVGKKNRLAAGGRSEMSPGRGRTGSPGDTAGSHLPTGAALEQEGKAVKVH